MQKTQRKRSNTRRKPPTWGEQNVTKSQQRQRTYFPHHRDQAPVSEKTGMARHTLWGGIPANDGHRTRKV